MLVLSVLHSALLFGVVQQCALRYLQFFEGNYKETERSTDSPNKVLPCNVLKFIPLKDL